MNLGANDTCCIKSAGSIHVKPRARTNGTRLATPELGVPGVAEPHTGPVLCAHSLRGVVGPAFTHNVGTLRQALQNFNDTSCSSSVDAYQQLSPPSHAWSRATRSASRQRLNPGRRERHNKPTTQKSKGQNIGNHQRLATYSRTIRTEREVSIGVLGGIVYRPGIEFEASLLSPLAYHGKPRHENGREGVVYE